MISGCACGSPNCPHCNPNIWTGVPENTHGPNPFIQRIAELEAALRNKDTELAEEVALRWDTEAKVERLTQERDDWEGRYNALYIDGPLDRALAENRRLDKEVLNLRAHMDTLRTGSRALRVRCMIESWYQDEDCCSAPALIDKIYKIVGDI